MNMDDGTKPSSEAGIAYVLKVFPRVSETFVINEIRAVESLGQRVSIFSLHHNPDGDGIVKHSILGELEAPLVYVDDVTPEDDRVAKARHKLEREFGMSGDDRSRFLPRKYVRLALRLAELIEENDIRWLHAHFASRAGHVSALASRLAGISYSITAHAKDIYHQEVDRDVLRWKIDNAGFVVTVTDYNLRYLREMVVDIPGAAEKVVRVYNGVDMSRFSAAEAATHSRPLLVSVGRLVEKKGFGVLVESCGLLRDRGYEFDCEIIGGGEQEQELRARIAELGLADRVSLAGTMTTEEVGERLRAATAVALPCVVSKDGNVDALPTVLLEAMATARPLVSTELSGIPEIISDGDNGFLVEPGDVAGLADAIARLLDDPDMAEQMGRAGRERAERLFDLHANAGTVRALIRQHLGKTESS